MIETYQTIRNRGKGRWVIVHEKQRKERKRRERNWFKTKERKTRLLSVLHETLWCSCSCQLLYTLLVGQAISNLNRRKRDRTQKPDELLLARLSAGNTYIFLPFPPSRNSVRIQRNCGLFFCSSNIFFSFISVSYLPFILPSFRRGAFAQKTLKLPFYYTSLV